MIINSKSHKHKILTHW